MSRVRISTPLKAFNVLALTLLLSLNAIGEPKTPTRFEIEFDGIKREYFVQLPAAYSPYKTYWLLVCVHGGGGNGLSHFLADGIRSGVDAVELDAIVVSPSFWNTDKQASRFPVLGEGAFLEAVVEDVSSKHTVHKEILLTGYSRGAQFTHRYAMAHPDRVKAAAPIAAGTWTTPEGELLIEGYGAVENPELFLTNSENKKLVTERLHDLFTERVAAVAGMKMVPHARQVSFLVMCGTLDTRIDIAKAFAGILDASGFHVKTEWPDTPHGGKEKAAYRDEFKKYSQEALRFFKAIVDGE